jgi:septal ring factor EnvC (AmiA/AmiB activator)
LRAAGWTEYTEAMTTNSPPATKQDVEEIVGRVVGEIVSDAMQTISDHMDVKFAEVDRRFEQVDRRFEQVDKRFEQDDRRFDQVDRLFDKLEDKLETTTEQVDHHGIDIRELKRRAA